ncbi:MAG TPA: energy transducer TonB [Longimicrobiales bacterium]|nr:energy transducer TonB [Longimicrobiales bacterium]
MSHRDLDPLAKSANERFRDLWRRQLRWSTAFAVALHGVLVGVSFSWQLSYAPLEPLEIEENQFLLLPGFGDASGEGPSVALIDSVPGALTEVEDEEDSGVTQGPLSSGADLATLWDALGDRLRGGGAPLPTLAETEVVAEEEEIVAAEEGPPASDEEGAPSIGGDAATIDLVELPEPDSLSLDRLSALRPELAFMTASAWVLIRNQAEVEAFLRRSYRSGRLDPEASGSVSVTLWIDRRGSVEWAEISRSSGRTDLDEFTLALFNEVAAFRAARERGVYVSRSVTFSVNYPW